MRTTIVTEHGHDERRRVSPPLVFICDSTRGPPPGSPSPHATMHGVSLQVRQLGERDQIECGTGIYRQEKF